MDEMDDLLDGVLEEVAAMPQQEEEPEVFAGDLNNVVDQQSLQWVFVGGKGGVGKTTTSCALAALLSRSRRSVLLVSTDPAHNLSDAWAQKFGPEPTKVDGFSNLYAMEVDAKASIAKQRSMMQQLSAQNGGASSAGGGGLLGQLTQGLAGELAGSFPGIDETISFTEMMKSVTNSNHDVVVFDTAPTGHTLKLLAFPETLQNAMSKIQGLSKQFGPLIGPAMAALTGQQSAPGASPLDGIMGQLEEIQKVVASVRQRMTDPTRTTFVCVAIPEYLSLYETERLVQQLAEFDVDVRNIVVNQVLFPDPDESHPWYRSRVRLQTKYLEQINALYSDFHVVQTPLLDEEVRGADRLRLYANLLVQPWTKGAFATFAALEAMEESGPEEDRSGDEAAAGGGSVASAAAGSVGSAVQVEELEDHGPAAGLPAEQEEEEEEEALASESAALLQAAPAPAPASVLGRASSLLAQAIDSLGLD